MVSLCGINTRSTPFDLTSEELARIERYRRLWLYYAAEDGNPYAPTSGAPPLSDFSGLPDYVADVFNCVPFVVNADLDLSLSGFTLDSIIPENDKSAVALREFASTLEVESVLRSALLSALVCGDAYIKVFPGPASPIGVRASVLDPASVFPRLNPHDGDSVENLLIKYSYEAPDGASHDYAELWTPTTVEVRNDNKPVTASSGSHPFGRIPIVHLSIFRLPGSYFGRPCFADIIADVDRLNTAAGAVFEIFKYYGAPKLILKGIMAPDAKLDPDLRQFWQIPDPAADIFFLEWKNTSNLVTDLLRLDSIVRRKMPEFVLDTVQERSIPASGYAVSLQLSLLQARINTLCSGLNRPLRDMLTLAASLSGRELPLFKTEIRSALRPAEEPLPPSEAK
ncbi:MAG: phage portal protein [Candidatus Brocadiia bacterium]